MTILFISDLHLEEQRPDITEIFLKFLKSYTRHAEALYILGDFFETWIGDDDLSPFNLMIIKALQTATHQGLNINFMHGNRDFLLGKRFFHATGCRLLPGDEYLINLYGVPTLLMHGDTLCTEDKKYLKFRKKYRNWFFQRLMLLKSLASRRALAAKIRAASREHTRTSTQYIMDVTQSEVERIMRKNNVQNLIHGHTHREAIHSFNLEKKPATRTVLGAWHTEGRILLCEPNGNQTLVAITNF